MLKIHHFKEGIKEYVSKKKGNDFPSYSCCEECGIQKKLYRHGFYERYVFVLSEKKFVNIVVCRYICQNPKCRQTYSVLPDFIIPYFQFPLPSIVELIDKKIEGVPLTEGIRQRATYYFKRYACEKHQNWILQFFRKSGNLDSIPEESIKKAKKLLKMIQDFGESTFLRKSTDTFSNYFMAPSLYQNDEVHST
ncbi:DUF6431 domain-containing protein [Aquibacillus sp. 3ASR75-11]|uniref:DUF6431 domain-containing protein n=1 Tax=Terrihalobacillus insolitus TaxID=2950438 RepID=A0A9X3WQI1_9BACI|nr:DUF6431 domain-containing protein [Terrihalobacillus insolitus]MDC3424242.1 DUF6431 domain-containing protein [Terrihalobacillus insolitus]